MDFLDDFLCLDEYPFASPPVLDLNLPVPQILLADYHLVRHSKKIGIFELEPGADVLPIVKQYFNTVFGQMGRNYTLQASQNFVSWVSVITFACTNTTMDVFDPAANNYRARFYRLAPPGAVPGLELRLGSAQPLSTNGLELMLLSTPGLNYRIEASPNLNTWTPITNFVTTGEVTRFLDSSATNYRQRFYRAVVP